MKRNWSIAGSAVALVVLAACSEDRTTGPAGQDAFARYVSLGTSVSMGVQSDGVYYASQQHAWPALLAHQAFATKFTEALLQGPGCYSPLIAPLQFQRRLSGAQYPAINAQDQICALLGSTTLPTNNVAIDGATTYAALRVTPETTAVAPANVESDQRKRLYKAVLLPKNSQVTEMMSQNPTLVSVELGANEVLRTVTGGILVPAADFILTAADTAFVDDLIRQMNAHISAQATAHSWSYFDFNGALSKFVAAKGHFSLNAFLTCTRPFGQYVSLDGIHPTADGQQEIANAAAAALNSTYGFQIPTVPVPVLTPAQLCP